MLAALHYSPPESSRFQDWLCRSSQGARLRQRRTDTLQYSKVLLALNYVKATQSHMNTTHGIGTSARAFDWAVASPAHPPSRQSHKGGRSRSTQCIVLGLSNNLACYFRKSRRFGMAAIYGWLLVTSTARY